jgi:hypothetical protein
MNEAEHFRRAKAHTAARANRPVSSKDAKGSEAR